MPERTCISCHRKRPKWELVRVVRTPDGNVDIDPRGKQSGRGAYVCAFQDCWEAVLKQKRLEYALRTELVPEQRSRLLNHMKTLPVLRSAAENSVEASR